MTDKNRRKFVKIISAATVAVPVSAIVVSLPSRVNAAMVDPNSSIAINLEYVEVSSSEGASCGTCALYQGKADKKGGLCPLFPGNDVAVDAWCKAYAKKSV